MGTNSVAWDHGYEDYFEGNGANPYEDIHLAQRWFEGWEAARQTHVEEEFEEKMAEVAPKYEGSSFASYDFWGYDGRSNAPESALED